MLYSIAYGQGIGTEAGIAAVETTLRAGMPELIRTMESMQSEVRQLRTTMDARFDKVDARFDKVDAPSNALRKRACPRWNAPATKSAWNSESNSPTSLNGC